MKAITEHIKNENCICSELQEGCTYNNPFHLMETCVFVGEIAK